ncbi:MAG: hypothetical protein HFJ80_07770 [Clostridiales bacterium]|nr:hypothetical protein [Clostridiales bacterium]
MIYANYPEQIGQNGKGMALAEYGYCINQQTITAGEAHVFFSHWNRSGETLKYRVHLYNMSAGTATVQRTNIGYSSGWADPGKTVKDFFQSSSTNITIPQGGSAWLTPEYSIASGQPFNGLIRFNTDRAIIVTIYMYRNVSAVDGYEVVYPYSTDYSEDMAVYTGVGKGYFLTASHGTIRTSEMPYRYVTNNVNSNDNEITPINIVGTNIQANENAAAPLNNLGNWCTQNYHVMTFFNDSDSVKTVYGYIGSNAIGNTSVVQRGSNVQSVRLEGGPRTWKWCKIELQPGESYTFDFQTILASYGAAATFHEWDIVDRMA